MCLDVCSAWVDSVGCWRGRGWQLIEFLFIQLVALLIQLISASFHRTRNVTVSTNTGPFSIFRLDVECFCGNWRNSRWLIGKETRQLVEKECPWAVPHFLSSVYYGHALERGARFLSMYCEIMQVFLPVDNQCVHVSARVFPARLRFNTFALSVKMSSIRSQSISPEMPPALKRIQFSRAKQVSFLRVVSCP